MLSIRIRILAAAAALVMAVGGAAAQTATPSAPGKPISLLQNVGQTGKTKPKPHAKIARKPITRTHGAIAAAKSPRTMALAQDASAPASVWPALAPAAPTAVAATDALQPQTASVDRDPSALVVGGQTVQVASPGDVNAIDLAADDQGDAASAAPKSDEAQAAPVVQAMIATSAQHDASPVGSATWIAQVLAALGGAIAAGSVAWFLIGSTPQRIYG
jgi:hypothetical protein